MARPQDMHEWFRAPRREGGGRTIIPGGGGGFADPVPGMAQGSGSNVVIMPPTVIRPPQAQSFRADGASVLGVPFSNANTPVVIPGSTFVVPSQNVAVIQSLVLSVNTLLATSIISYRLLVNSAPVEGWAPIRIFPTPASAFLLSFAPEETQIPITEGATISVEITVDPADGASYQAGASFNGWYYDKTTWDTYARAWSVA